MPNPKQQLGQVCEAILHEHLLRLGWYVYRHYGAQAPADIIAINEDGRVLLFDAKADGRRTLPGRKKPTRISRVLTPAQRALGVRIAYVDHETRGVHIVPALD